jgi:hypothetical protein
MIPELIVRDRDLRHRVRDLETQESIPIVARYQTDAGQSIPNNTLTIVNFEDLVIDTWSAVTVGASWAFTAPVGGYYQVSVYIEFAATTNWVVGERAEMVLYKNGGAGAILDAQENHGATSHRVTLQGDDTIELAAGDTLDVRVTQVSGAALALRALGDTNHVAIHRIGD